MKKTTKVKNFIREHYAWPGGYPQYAVCSDGLPLCHECVKENAKLIIKETRNRGMWEVVAIDINWEDQDLCCDNCSKKIESAYGGE